MGGLSYHIIRPVPFPQITPAQEAQLLHNYGHHFPPIKGTSCFAQLLYPGERDQPLRAAPSEPPLYFYLFTYSL